jgi:acetolactate synthase-1/3 small subunit
MTETLHIQIDHAEGSLQRLIGLIERRGFFITRMSVADLGSHREVRLGVRGRDAGRSADVLSRQIDRLVGVSRVNSASSTAVEEVVPCPA